MENCVFCRIINGEIPTEFVYKDEELVAFRDINPKAPVHILIVPRKHIPSINELEDGDRELLGNLLLTAKKIAQEQGVDKSGYRLSVNVGEGGGQDVFHLHMHLKGGWKGV
ncbi:MAG: histidine triad nucleotide-binding protein [bacterium]|nr:histidine triad nucleotide-binding protein [bacterium]